MRTLSPVWRLLVLLTGLVLLAVPALVRRAVFKPVAALPYLQDEASESRDELSMLRRQAAELHILREKNQRLADAAARLDEFRTLLSRLEGEPVKWLNGTLCGARFGPGGDRYLIKVDSSREILPGYGVVKGYAAFGTIVEAEGNAGWVLPLDVLPSRAAVIVTRSRAEGLLEASRDGLFLRYVWASGSGTPPLLEGDVVVTSGRAGVFPRGIIVGRIKGGLGRSQDGLHVEAEVDPEFRYLPGDLAAVTVVNRPPQESTGSAGQEGE